MNMPTQSAQGLGPGARRLTIHNLNLVGGDRQVSLKPGLNLVHGNITTGKTTFVRLIRSLLGTVPSGLPEETAIVSDLRARLNLGGQLWEVNRPLSSTRTAPVDVVEVLDQEGREPRTLRLPAVGSQSSFGRFLLDQMHIPAVSVPQARSKPTEGLTPVTMSDWLGYCVITGDEIDAQVFGHHHPFRDQKRRWVFELAYGLYDAEVAKLAAALKSIEIKIGALDREEDLQKRFLAETPFSDSEALIRRIAELDAALAENANQSMGGVSEVVATFDVGVLREELLSSRAKTRQLADEIRKNDGQLKDLVDLLGQLRSQFSRLTRAIISDEWLVDFDFVVCPRCGSDVELARATAECCYLCLQTPSSSSSRESFVAEQERIVTQIQETESVISARRKSLQSLKTLYSELSEREGFLSAQLDSRTQTFVSDRESHIAESASRRAYLAAERKKAEEYLRILERFQLTFSSRQELEEQKAEIEDRIARRELTTSASESYIELLEDRLLGYLSRLNVPHFDAGLSVAINRKTYLPEISGRTFDELSSQGLKTLVNVAHSLAHHTVAIDNDLPMPGLLVLDGLSANAGRRGFDEDRIRDMYALLMDVSEEYGDRLQIIAVDNDPPAGMWDVLSNMEILHLTQEDKLIRLPTETIPSQAQGAE